MQVSVRTLACEDTGSSQHTHSSGWHSTTERAVVRCAVRTGMDGCYCASWFEAPLLRNSLCTACRSAAGDEFKLASKQRMHVEPTSTAQWLNAQMIQGLSQHISMVLEFDSSQYKPAQCSDDSSAIISYA